MASSQSEQTIMGKGPKIMSFPKAMQAMDGPTISRAAYYAWQQAWDVKNRDPGVVGE